VKLIGGKPILAPPKGGKIPEVPLPEWVDVAVAEHIRRHPPIEVALPWRELDGEPRTSRLIFTTRQSGPLNRNYFNPKVWKPALEAVGIAAIRDHGMHALRHHYASVLLDGGISHRPALGTNEGRNLGAVDRSLLWSRHRLSIGVTNWQPLNGLYR
jgi:integrase